MNITRHEEEEEEDEVAVEKVASWYLHVHIHDKLITVACGDASQKVKWLAHVAIGKLYAPKIFWQFVMSRISFLQRDGTRRTARAGHGLVSR